MFNKKIIVVLSLFCSSLSGFSNETCRISKGKTTYECNEFIKNYKKDYSTKCSSRDRDAEVSKKSCPKKGLISTCTPKEGNVKKYYYYKATHAYRGRSPILVHEGLRKTCESMYKGKYEKVQLLWLN
jgi:hypothetical protein